LFLVGSPTGDLCRRRGRSARRRPVPHRQRAAGRHDGDHRGAVSGDRAPSKLVYTWRTDQGIEEWSLVTVRFELRGDATEVTVVHDQIASEPVRDSHEKGWNGCLDGLALYFEAREQIDG